MTDKAPKKTDLMSEAERDAYHAEKMRKKKEARNKILATKTEERGLLIVHTGKGKGKSTAAFGMVFRAIGHGFKVGVVQFVKGAWSTGERDVLDRFPEQVTIKAMGEGFTWDTQDRQRDLAAARGAWEMAKELIADESYKLILLDELNIVLRYDYLPLDEVLEVLRNKPRDTHVIVTGRNAKDELIELADLVTEMTEIKHPSLARRKRKLGLSAAKSLVFAREGVVERHGGAARPLLEFLRLSQEAKPKKFHSFPQGGRRRRCPLLQPPGIELRARVDVDALHRAERPELVRGVCRHHQDLAGPGLDLLVAYREHGPASLDDERLGVGVGVEPRSGSLLDAVVEDHRDIGFTAFPLARLAGGVHGPVLASVDPRHQHPPLRLRTSCSTTGSSLPRSTAEYSSWNAA
ncbi:MAG: cobO [Devosia sp.]|nr:cobO [Devosia sp.]